MTRLALSVSLLAGAALAYEVLLFRLLGIVQWHPFAAMIISLALLGHGAAGTALALAGARLLPRFEAAYAAGAALFALAVPLCWALAQRLPFNGLELVWAPGQLLRLGALFLLLSFPFFFAAGCFGLAFMHARERIPALYAADLFGAGAGAALGTALLFLLPPGEALRGPALLGAGAALLAPGDWRPRAALPAVAVLAAATLPGAWLAPAVNEFKSLPRTLAVQGAAVETERSSPYGLLTVVRNDTVPFRHVPGRSLLAASEPPAQRLVFVDGDGPGAITAFGGDPAALVHLDETPSALPYHLAAPRRVLVLGAGGGAQVLQALHHGATAIDAVERNPQMVALVRDTYGDFSGGLYRRPEVRVTVSDARGFVRATGGRYDLVQLAPLDSHAGAGAGVQAVAESYLYTVEALGDYLARLAPGGALALTRWEKQPPRESLKLFATAVAALRARGLDPAPRLALVRGWQTSTLVLKPDGFDAAELDRLRTFCARRGFDPAYYPGISPAEVNRRHRVARPWLHEGALALLGPEPERFVDAYPFRLAPATDDRPYFFHFFRWPLLPELYERRGQGGLTLLDTGYLVLFATLALALPLSLLLVAAPLAALPRDPGPARARAGGYFLCLGLAFLFVEIAMLQRYGLFIGEPLLAAVTVLAGFLVFAGAGSRFAARFAHRRGAAAAAVAGIVLLLALHTVGPPPPGLLAGTGARVALTLALVAPLAFLMGLPFPLGLSRLATEAPAFIPWAWGINGCASVLSALLAALLALHVGFAGVLLAAAALYVTAVLIWR